MSRSYLLAFLFSFSILVFDRLGWLRLLKGPAEAILVVPLRQYVYENKLNWDRRFAFVNDGQKLNEQLRLLEKEKAFLEAENLRLNILERENQAMRLLLQAPLSPESKFILAHPLVFESGELLLDVGLESGVKIGKEVVSENNLIGYIFKVEPNLSRARLLTHAESVVKAAAINSASEKAAGILKGQFGTTIRLTEILQADNFSLGDRVVAILGNGGLNNLLIGEVTKIDKKESELYQEAEVGGFVDVKRLEVVFVVQ